MLFKIPTKHCRFQVIPEQDLRLLLYYLLSPYALSQTDQFSDVSSPICSKQNVCVCPSYSFPLVLIQHIRYVLLIQALSSPAVIHFSNGLAQAKNSKIIFFCSNLIALPMGSVKTDDVFSLVLTTENALKVCKLSTSLTSLHLFSSQHPP